MNQPIERLFEKIEDAVEYGYAGHNPFTPLQVVTNAFQLVFQTVIFVQDCKYWKRTTPDDKTWANFKTFFATAHQEWRESQATTSGNMYSTAPISGASANAVHQHNDTANAIACLATATAANIITVATLASTNSKVTAELSAVNSKLVFALNEITLLTNVFAKLQLSKSGKDGQPGRGTAIDMAVGPIHYFWAHGHSCLHPSHICPSPAANHKKEAKASDTKGGSNANKNV